MGQKSEEDREGGPISRQLETPKCARPAGPMKVFLSLPRLLAGLQHLCQNSPEDSKEVVLPGAVVPWSRGPSPMAVRLRPHVTGGLAR